MIKMNYKPIGGNEETTFFEGEKMVPNNYDTIEIHDERDITTIEFRRVNRVDAAIQINAKQYNKRTNRMRMICFSIPDCMCELFIESIKKK